MPLSSRLDTDHFTPASRPICAKRPTSRGAGPGRRRVHRFGPAPSGAARLRSNDLAPGTSEGLTRRNRNLGLCKVDWFSIYFRRRLNKLSTTPNYKRTIRDERWKFFFRINAIIGTLVFLTFAGCGGGADESDSGVAKNISGEELQARLGAPNIPVILDVRTSGEFASGHIPGAIHIPHTQVSRRLKELEEHRDREIVVYCARGPRAYSAESVLRKAGFDKVRHLRGDITGWRRDGRPVTR